MNGTEPSWFFHLITEHWGTMLTLGGGAVGAFVFVWYTLKQTIPSVVSKMTAIEKSNKEAYGDLKERLEEIRTEQNLLERRARDLGFAKRGEFYDDKGQPLFQLRLGCLDMRDGCIQDRRKLEQSICTKVEEVKRAVSDHVQEINAKLTERDQEASEQRDQISTVLNRVEKLIEKDRQVERRGEMLELVEAIGDKLADSIIGKMKGGVNSSFGK